MGRSRWGLTLCKGPKFKRARVNRELPIELSICQYLATFRISHPDFFFRKVSVRGFYDPRGFYRKDTNPWAIPGAPDIECIWRGLFIGLEVKAKGGTQSDEQRAFEQLVKSAGGFYFVVYSIDETEHALRQVAASRDQSPNPS